MGELAGFAKYNGEAKTFIFPNGSRLELGYCDNEGDVSVIRGLNMMWLALKRRRSFPKNGS